MIRDSWSSSLSFRVCPMDFLTPPKVSILALSVSALITYWFWVWFFNMVFEETINAGLKPLIKTLALIWLRCFNLFFSVSFSLLLFLNHTNSFLVCLQELQSMNIVPRLKLTEAWSLRPFSWYRNVEVSMYSVARIWFPPFFVRLENIIPPASSWPAEQFHPKFLNNRFFATAGI